MAQQIQIRRDTSTNWTSVNPTLAQGELGFETNTNKLKIGDGTTAWNSLAYFGGAGALASLSDVTVTSLASGQVLIANASSIFINKSLSSLVNEYVSFSSLGSLAVMNQLSFTSLTNQPSLSSLAFQSTIDYTTTQIINKPSLGSLAVMNQLSFTSLLNQPSLGSLAVLNSLTKSDVGLGNVTNDAQLKIASNLSDLNNIETARGNLSLGSLAVLNSVPAVLPSTASFDILFSNGIVNYSTISTNLLNSKNAVFASQVSIQNVNGHSLYFNSGIIGGLDVTTLVVGGLTNTNGGLVNSSTISTNSLTVTTDIVAPNVNTFRAFYGDGVDGAVTLDGGTASRFYSFASLNTATSEYTLLRDVYATTFTVNQSHTLKTGGYRIFATEYILNNGTIDNSGSAGSGSTAGTGGAGGFFRAGGNGATGLAAGASGIGAFPPLPATNVNLIGVSGGRGGAGRAGVTTFTGTNVALASTPAPSASIGGKQLIDNVDTYFKAFIPATATTNIQIQPSLGGGSGAKSTGGTAATSGGGGGGGGIVFLSSPSIVNNSFIYALGGNGGNAAGSAGNGFGGGGGGGGGIVAYITRKSAPSITAFVDGGSGGTSAGNGVTSAVTKADNTFSSTATIQYVTMTPTQNLSLNTLYMLSMHVTFDAGTLAGINAVTGFGCSWTQEQDVRFGTIATPTRALFVFRGAVTNANFDYPNDNRIKIEFSDPVSSIRVVLDEIQNGPLSSEIAQSATFTSDSSANPLTVLGTAPTTGNTQYSVVARAGGTALTGGTGVTLVNNQTSAPLLATMVAVSRTTSNASYTTAGAVGMATLDINQPASMEDGISGWNGKVIRFNV